MLSSSCSEQKLAAAEQNNGMISTYPATSFTSLQRAMAANNVTWIDILKIDVEGGKQVLTNLLAATLPVRQMTESWCDCRGGVGDTVRVACSEYNNPNHSGTC
jgi:hypothetical protein